MKPRPGALKAGQRPETLHAQRWGFPQQAQLTGSSSKAHRGELCRGAGSWDSFARRIWGYRGTGAAALGDQLQSPGPRMRSQAGD